VRQANGRDLGWLLAANARTGRAAGIGGCASATLGGCSRSFASHAGDTDPDKGRETLSLPSGSFPQID
jgi:hypothetical protein